jgi:hypothetical protein
MCADQTMFAYYQAMNVPGFQMLEPAPLSVGTGFGLSGFKDGDKQFAFMEQLAGGKGSLGTPGRFSTMENAIEAIQNFGAPGTQYYIRGKRIGAPGHAMYAAVNWEGTLVLRHPLSNFDYVLVHQFPVNLPEPPSW